MILLDIPGPCREFYTCTPSNNNNIHKTYFKADLLFANYRKLGLFLESKSSIDKCIVIEHAFYQNITVHIYVFYKLDYQLLVKNSPPIY